MRKLRDEMEKTHLEEQGLVKLEEDLKPTIKSEDGEVKMEDVADAPHSIDSVELATSPLTKKRLASRPSVRSPPCLLASLPLTFSLIQTGPTITPLPHLHHLPLRIDRPPTSGRQQTA